ncbi:MAG: hypothetical protein WC683_14700 [bacterium]
MDPYLKAMCVEVLQGNVDSERFAWLLIDTGIILDSHEWDVANHLLRQGDAIASLTQKFGYTVQ